jgi:hypothetical protein
VDAVVNVLIALLDRCVQQAAAQPFDCRPQDPGDVHLGAADPLGDLRLGEVADEPHGDHAEFPFGQPGQQRA